MPATSTEKLAEDIDRAVRNAYQEIRTALNRVEDLKITLIGKGDMKSPFAPEHDEIYAMYLDLSKRFQETREKVRGRNGPAQPRPSTSGPVPRTDEPSTRDPPPRRSKSRPYVLVPVCLFEVLQKAIFIHYSREVPFPPHRRLITAPINANRPPQRKKTGNSKANEKRWDRRMSSPPILKANKVQVTS